jgi:hypothetical protein
LTENIKINHSMRNHLIVYQLQILKWLPRIINLIHNNSRHSKIYIKGKNFIVIIIIIIWLINKKKKKKDNLLI